MGRINASCGNKGTFGQRGLAFGHMQHIFYLKVIKKSI